MRQVIAGFSLGILLSVGVRAIVMGDVLFGLISLFVCSLPVMIIGQERNWWRE